MSLHDALKESQEETEQKDGKYNFEHRMTEINPFEPNGLFHIYKLDESNFSFERCLVNFFILIIFKKTL